MLKGNEIIYQIFVRNYSKDGSFKSITNDLQRIKELGIDIIYLMPINEIGIKNRKGNYGSPYASKDYYSISPDLGTLDDLKYLIDEVHKNNMKIIVDMVFNHTAPDSKLFFEHPEFYFRKPDGSVGNRVGDWSDIIDLDTSREDTQDYLISVLEYWKNVGFDGFRFDVASMINLNLFKKAREKLGNEVIFLSESIDDGFVEYVKQFGIYSTPDQDMFPIFDCLYNYSWYRPLENHLKNGTNIQEMLDAINRDKDRMPKNFLRCNCLENHDNERIANLIKNKGLLKEWIKFSFYLKGCPFIYAGEEYGIKHKPNLFEKDPINWDDIDEEIFNLFKDLIVNKHNSMYFDYNVSKTLNNKVIVERIKENQIIESGEFDLE